MPVYHPFLNFTNSIRLPEYGFIGITELEKKIIDTNGIASSRKSSKTKAGTRDATNNIPAIRNNFLLPVVSGGARFSSFNDIDNQE